MPVEPYEDDDEEQEGPRSSFGTYLAEGDALFKQSEYKKALESYSMVTTIICIIWLASGIDSSRPRLLILRNFSHQEFLIPTPLPIKFLAGTPNRNMVFLVLLPSHLLIR